MLQHPMFQLRQASIMELNDGLNWPLASTRWENLNAPVQMDVVGRPKSCTDLWRIGHTFSAFFSVTGEEKVESVYCDFTKLLT